MTLAAGTRLDTFEIIAPLGAGGMGEVYRARDPVLKREVAIKVLPSYLSKDPDRLHRFEQEAQATAALSHPNIVSIFHVGQYDGSPYIVTELLQGETLRDRLRKGPMRLREVLDYDVELARGLAAAHDAGIVHRDLKPDNIFITKDGRLKILDFGLAKLDPAKSASADGLTASYQPQSHPGHVVGTVGYMSPEQVRGHVADARSDIFAVGVTLYEMLTGKPAFRKATSADTISAILNEDPPAVSQVVTAVPPGLQRIVNRCLEKSPEQRFQHASDLAFALDALSDSNITTPGDVHRAAREVSRLQIVIGGAALALALATGLLVYLGIRPAPAPRVSNFVQLTHDGQPKDLVGTEGSRLYLYLTGRDYQGMAEMSTSGGEPRKMSTLPSTNLSPLSLSPDGAELLMVDTHGGATTGPLWSVPVLGGSPRRLPETDVYGAAWSSDGKLLAYSNGSNIFVANADGSAPRKLVSLKSPTYIYHPVWSPDGGRLRFDVQEGLAAVSYLWEVSADGTGLHRLLPGWSNGPDSECCGKWTADGKHFVFQSRGQIWALPRTSQFFHAESKPIQLTSSPLRLSSPVPSTDGKRLYVVAQEFHGELVRYDLKSGQFVPFLGGISAEFVAFSKDGQWVSYVSFPEGTLWRSKVDGSERLQLTYPPSYAVNPRWSPDGKNIVFFATDADKPPKIYAVSPEGGSPQPLMPDEPGPQLDPNWSPDGDRIVFSGGGGDPASSIHILDLTTHQTTMLQGSRGLFSPRWSPDGRYIAAVSADERHLLLFDFRTQKWAEVAKGRMGWPGWSKDGQYLYVQDANGTGALIKILLGDQKTERIVDLKNFVATSYYYPHWSAVALDDSPLLLRDTGSQNIYSLDWEEQ